jgi:hypothetical protein
MQCETCKGSGQRVNPALRVTINQRAPLAGVRIHNPSGLPIMVPCPDCGGCGIMSCCDGAAGTEADLEE